MHCAGEQGGLHVALMSWMTKGTEPLLGGGRERRSVSSAVKSSPGFTKRVIPLPPLPLDTQGRLYSVQADGEEDAQTTLIQAFTSKTFDWTRSGQRKSLLSFTGLFPVVPSWTLSLKCYVNWNQMEDESRL